MTETRFTPGPWFVGGEGLRTSVYTDADWQTLGTLVAQATPFGADREVRYANARLIASAPALTTEGAFLVARLEEFEVSSLATPDAYREWAGHVMPAVERFRAVLSQAQGVADTMDRSGREKERDA
jgi:hypothetical protein